jgi:hypothetical protein
MPLPTTIAKAHRLTCMCRLEDDADWDVAIKLQALQGARATRFLLDQPERRGKEPLSPYGDGWDIIWFGHCRSPSRPTLDDMSFPMIRPCLR